MFIDVKIFIFTVHIRCYEQLVEETGKRFSKFQTLSEKNRRYRAFQSLTLHSFLKKQQDQCP